MGILKTGLKVIGSATLGAVGIASAVVRVGASAIGVDILADGIGVIQDASFEAIRDMWTPDKKKTDKYYEAKAERSAERAENAARSGEAKRREYERMKEKMNREK